MIDPIVLAKDHADLIVRQSTRIALSWLPHEALTARSPGELIAWLDSYRTALRSRLSALGSVEDIPGSYNSIWRPHV